MNMSMDNPASTETTAIMRLNTSDMPVEDMFAWEVREVVQNDWRTGEEIFAQTNVEVPSTWSRTATTILATKYFRGTPGTTEREHSLKEVVGRIVNKYRNEGLALGYFADDAEADVFADELKFLLYSQRAAFNSPVWFNVGVEDVPQQVSACFILSVEDDMESILNWYKEEGIIFKGGSGAGVNLSKIRSSAELLKGGGSASGPVSFMRGADASAGTIKSGGKTRRAAKMVILDVDHPDVEEFIATKAHEETKIRALRDAGFDMTLDGADMVSIQYQNANNSVRVTDEFMQAVERGEDWHLRAVNDGSIVKTIAARELFRQIAQAAWDCADPGMQFDTTINRWHTAADTSRINGSNPCSEYMHVDDSSCNLASINLLPYLLEDNSFDVDGYMHTVRVLITAMDISVSFADFPTKAIEANTRRFRQLGLGYANLGALLMALGVGYDTDAGRTVAAALTAVMHNTAYAVSGRLASQMGPYDSFAENAASHNKVLRMHAEAVEDIDVTMVDASMRVMVENLVAVARQAGEVAVQAGETQGVRNAQVTVLAPTGTIGLLMDCDTTGVEPDLGLVKFKTLVGGGSLEMVNQTVPRALTHLGYTERQVETIVAYIETDKTIVGAPGLDPAHLAVFACSMGDNTIAPLGHVRMMAAVQPFISGAISKTVNLPEDTTVEEIERTYTESWRLGVKAVAVYRDNCKTFQVLHTVSKDSDNAETAPVPAVGNRPLRDHPPRERTARNIECRVGETKFFLTIGEYADGRPCEIFIKISKQGSTMAGVVDGFCKVASKALQYGMPLDSFVQDFLSTRFEPSGMTEDPDVRIAQSIFDFVARKMAILYLPAEIRQGLGVYTIAERTEAVNGSAEPADTSVIETPATSGMVDHGELCGVCGSSRLRRAGACSVCEDCGSTTGCS